MKTRVLGIACLLIAATLCVGQSAAPAATQDAQQLSGDQAGQQQTPPAAQRQKSTDKPTTLSPPPESGASKDRLFFTLPNFLTIENAGQVPPMTAREKFAVVTRGSFDYVQYPWYAFLAGISQAEDSEPGFGQGAEGYAKRFGAYMADGTIENFMTGAILPSLLREDPRYFQSGHGGFWKRTGYAVSRIVVTRTDSGHNSFNFSEVVGSAMSAGISTYSYHPRGDRTLSNTASVWGTQLSYDSLTLVVKEFWPDIRRKLKKQPH